MSTAITDKQSHAPHKCPCCKQAMPSDAIPALRDMTLQELADELSKRGFRSGVTKIKAFIQAGFFPFAKCVEREQCEFLIMSKGFEEWAAENSVMETPI